MILLLSTLLVTVPALAEKLEPESLNLCFKMKVNPEAFKFGIKDEDRAECDAHKDEVAKEVQQYRNLKAVQVPCSIKLPIKTAGCQGEGCGNFESVILKKDLEIVKEVGGKAVVEKLNKGSKIEGPFKFYIYTTQFRKLRLLDLATEYNEKKFKRGDVLSIIAYESEGSHTFCDGSSKGSIELYDGHYQEIDKGQIEEWIGVKLPSKVYGFLKLSDVETNSEGGGE